MPSRPWLARGLAAAAGGPLRGAPLLQRRRGSRRAKTVAVLGSSATSVEKAARRGLSAMVRESALPVQLPRVKLLGMQRAPRLCRQPTTSTRPLQTVAFAACSKTSTLHAVAQLAKATARHWLTNVARLLCSSSTSKVSQWLHVQRTLVICTVQKQMPQPLQPRCRTWGMLAETMPLQTHRRA